MNQWWMPFVGQFWPLKSLTPSGRNRVRSLVDLMWSSASQRAVRHYVAVIPEESGQADLSLPAIGVVMLIELSSFFREAFGYVLDGAPQPFHQDVVVWALSFWPPDLDLLRLQFRHEIARSELVALIRVEDRRLATICQCHLQSSEKELRVQCVQELPAEHISGEQIYDCHQVEKSILQRDLGDISYRSPWPDQQPWPSGSPSDRGIAPTGLPELWSVASGWSHVKPSRLMRFHTRSRLIGIPSLTTLSTIRRLPLQGSSRNEHRSCPWFGASIHAPVLAGSRACISAAPAATLAAQAELRVVWID